MYMYIHDIVKSFPLKTCGWSVCVTCVWFMCGVCIIMCGVCVYIYVWCVYVCVMRHVWCVYVCVCMCVVSVSMWVCSRASNSYLPIANKFISNNFSFLSLYLFYL